mgnify:CR=1 FL=1
MGGNTIVDNDLKRSIILDNYQDARNRMIPENTDNYIIPYFGDLEPKLITNPMLRDVVNYWQNRQDIKGDKMKWTTVRNILSLLKQILIYAKQELGETVLITEFSLNPIKDSNITHRKVWTVSEQRHIVHSALRENSNRNLGIIIAINCGLRIGEICALQWKDVDIRMGVIYIRNVIEHDFCTSLRKSCCNSKTNTVRSTCYKRHLTFQRKVYHK